MMVKRLAKKKSAGLRLHSREGSCYAVISFGRSSTPRSRRSSGVTVRLRGAPNMGSAAIAATALPTGCESLPAKRLGVLRISSMRLRTLNFTKREET